MSKYHKKKVVEETKTTTRTSKVTPRKPWATIFMLGCLALFVLSFLYMNFIAGPPAANNRNVGAGTNIPPPTKIAEPKFMKEGELSFSNGEKEIVKINIEVADTDQTITQGLMFRKSMDEKNGMLFKFQNMDERSFWMKNTLIPLDIIYIDNAKKIVSIQKNMPPYSESKIPSNGLAQYVVEVNAGFCDSYEIKVGDVVSF